jgi:Bacteriophage tail sheath protein
MAAFTYPGVYIEEISSGQHTITGVATSIAAFIGWTNQGPINEAVMVESWAQYQATFGGMIPGNYLGYAVYQFFLNGGSQAYIIRLINTASGSGLTVAATASGTFGAMQLFADNPGAWGNNVCVSITNVVTAAGVTTFNLQVSMLNPSGTPATVESYTNLSTSPTSPQYALTVINNDSNYISFNPQPPASPATSVSAPTKTATAVWIIAGAVTGAGFTSLPETITQSGTSSTANLIGVVNGSYLVLSAAPGGTPNSSGAWTDGSGGSFAPTTAPVSTTAFPLVLGSSPALGADGTPLTPSLTGTGGGFETQLTSASGYQLLSNVPIFNLLCVPGENNEAVVSLMQQFCWTNRAFLIVDSIPTANISQLTGGPVDGGSNLLSSGQYASNSAFYFPWISAPDPQVGFRPTPFPPCGFVAGLYASTDASRGVWKAPAGINIPLTGTLGLQTVLTDLQNGQLNPVAVNCLRQFPIYGEAVWGTRTMAGADAVGSQWKYVPIRRLALFLESSLYQGTQWAVFEPNAEPLWGQVRLSIGTFMQGLFLQGAFAGTTPQQAYFVKCDSDNNPDSSIALGILNVTVGFAPLYPAEFVVIQIQQMMNQS